MWQCRLAECGVGMARQEDDPQQRQKTEVKIPCNNNGQSCLLKCYYCKVNDIEEVGL